MGVSLWVSQTEHDRAAAGFFFCLSFQCWLSLDRPWWKNPESIQSESRLRLFRSGLETKNVSSTTTLLHVLLKLKPRMLHWCSVLPQPGRHFLIRFGWLTLSPSNYTIGELLQVCGDTRTQTICTPGPTHGILTLAPQSIVGL